MNNVLGFPYIFRGALDVRASTINDAMKIAAAQALAKLAREDVPDELDAAYSGRRLRYGPEYILPVPFDPRLISVIPSAVAKAAVDSGVARRPIVDMKAYRRQLSTRRDPTEPHGDPSPAQGAEVGTGRQGRPAGLARRVGPPATI